VAKECTKTSEATNMKVLLGLAHHMSVPVLLFQHYDTIAFTTLKLFIFELCNFEYSYFNC